MIGETILDFLLLVMFIAWLALVWKKMVLPLWSNVEERVKKDPHLYDPDWQVRWMFRPLPEEREWTGEEKEAWVRTVWGPGRIPGNGNWAYYHYFCETYFDTPEGVRTRVAKLEHELDARLGLTSYLIEKKKQEQGYQLKLGE